MWFTCGKKGWKWQKGCTSRVLKGSGKDLKAFSVFSAYIKGDEVGRKRE
jgi:hypothetical protein